MRLLVVALVLVTSARGFDFEKCKFLDLSHEIKRGVPHWGDHDFEMQHILRGRAMGIEHVEANLFSMPEHFATHADTPTHFMNRPSQRTEKVPLRKFVGPACVIDIAEKAKQTLNYGLTLDDIEEWESDNGDMPRGCIVLIYTGWEFKWESPKDFLGAGVDNDTDLTHFNHPGVTKSAADFLVYKRYIRGLGTDTLSFDVGSAATARHPFPAHHVVLGNNIPGYENLNNLHQLPPLGATVAMNPLKISDGSGAPVRAWAIGWDGLADPCKRPH